jgi:outer membrane protein
MTRRLQGIRWALPARKKMAATAILWIGAISASCSSLYAQAAPTDRQAQPPTAAPIQAPSPAPVPTLTLSQALAFARQNNRQNRIAELQVEAAQQRAAAARTGLLPKITLQALGGQLVDTVSAHFPAGVLGTVNGSPVPSHDIDVKTPSRFSEAYTLGIAQPITQVPRIRTGIRILEAGVDIAREQERQRRQASAATVREIYHAILQTEETIAAGDEQLKALQQTERTVAENVSREAALRADLLEVQARRIQQETALATARDTLQQYKEQLNLLLGRDTQTPFEVAPVADDAPLESDASVLVDRALRNRPELHVGALQVRQAELDRRSTELERVPDLSLAMNYAAMQSDINGLPDHVWTVGFQVSWDGLDWGRRRRESAAKKKSIEQARLALDEARSQVQIDVRNQLRRWREARETESAARAAQQAAQERLRVTANQFQSHAALLKDVLQAQAALADANRQVQDAALASLTAQSELQRSLGEE